MTADALTELARLAAAPVALPAYAPGGGTLADLCAWAASVRTRPDTEAPQGTGTSGAAVFPPIAAARMLVTGLSPAEAVVEDGASEPVPVAAVPDGDAAGAAQRGADAVDALVDEGADLILLVTGTGPVDLRAALALVSVLCRVEPAKLVDYAAAREDQRWMADLAGLRDARRDASRHRSSPGFAAEALGSAALLSAAGALLQAAVRRTPVLLDGTIALAAALVAGGLSPGVEHWYATAPTGTAPETAVLQQLRLVTSSPLAGGGPAGASAILQLRTLQMALHIGRIRPDPTMPLTATN